MAKMERALDIAGYEVHNVSYPSRKGSVEDLARQVRASIVARCSGDRPVNVVAHSLGGILLRWIQAYDPLPRVGRVVMLSPPNHGSEVVDVLGNWKLFAWLNGPAGRQLGTGAEGMPSQLGAPEFEFGILTGDRSINWVLSRMIPGKDDGKVSVASAQLEGMRDFRVLPTAHPFIMKHRAAIAATLSFLEHGRFVASGAD
jgi:pimeloyl-ACP methyl ester carboxylesterase